MQQLTDLGQAIGSYCGQFMISAIGCRAMMPDSGFYRECMQKGFDELFLASQQKHKESA